MKNIFRHKTNPPDVKYLEELIDEITYSMSQLILNVYNGVSRNIGITDLNQIKRDPEKLRKGVFDEFSNIAKSIKGFFGQGSKSLYAPFKIRGMSLYNPDGKPTTQVEWNKFTEQLLNYMRPYTNTMADEFAIKGVLLALASAEAERQGQDLTQYGKRSYKQIENDLFSGYIPDSSISARERYQINQDVEQASILAHTNAAGYMTKVSDELREAVQQQIIAAHRQKKTPQQLASDLYWMKDEVPEMKKFTAEIKARDWQRVATTELARIHEDVKMASNEAQTRNSLTDQTQAVYSIFTGSGRCKWCSPRQGTLVRQVPVDFVKDPGDDSLSGMGISDQHTNIAVWQGKNNVGYPEAKWRICGNIHPWCQCTLTRIYPDVQEYDPNTRRIRLKSKAGFDTIRKFMPADILQEHESVKARNRERRELQEADKLKQLHKKDSEYYLNWGATREG